MRILYCVQRYGEEIAGGAEAACRSLAERMARRGHEVEVLTTCALSYNDWSDHFPEGTSTLNGIVVHRVRVREPRTTERFWPLHVRTTDPGGAALAVERDWLRTLGPDAPSFVAWLTMHAGSFDVVVFFTYLYATTGLAVRAAAEVAPVVLQPTAHDEPAFWLDVYRPMYDAVTALAFLTPEEQQLAAARRVDAAMNEVVGLGVDTTIIGDGERFRRDFELGGEPLVVYLGRIDPGKGPDELFRFMTYLIDAGRTDARFVVVGEAVMQLPDHPGVTFTGFVDEQTKADALAAATVFVQPSYFESFSLSLCEAWVQGRPALVQGRCTVLRGQVERSGGGIPYSGLAAFDAALRRLLSDPNLREHLGVAGRAYVEASYAWPAVLDRYETLLERVIGAR